MPRKWLRRWMPDPHKIREHRWLSRLGPALHHPRLWHISRKGIALGAALGIFWGLIIPFGQMPMAAIAAILLRANLPMAVAGTFITNPFTFAPLYYLAYRLGLLLTGAQGLRLTGWRLPLPGSAPELHGLSGKLAYWYAQLLLLGRPLFIGLLVMASVLAVCSYFGIQGLWRLHTVRAWRRRVTQRRRQ